MKNKKLIEFLTVFQAWLGMCDIYFLKIFLSVG